MNQPTAQSTEMTTIGQPAHVLEGNGASDTNQQVINYTGEQGTVRIPLQEGVVSTTGPIEGQAGAQNQPEVTATETPGWTVTTQTPGGIIQSPTAVTNTTPQSQIGEDNTISYSSPLELLKSTEFDTSDASAWLNIHQRLT